MEQSADGTSLAVAELGARETAPVAVANTRIGTIDSIFRDPPWQEDCQIPVDDDASQVPPDADL